MTGNTTNTWTRTRPEIPENKELTNEPNKPITKTYANRKVYSSFRDNTSEVDLPDVQLINKYNKGVKFLLEVLIFTANILGLFKKSVAISNEFQKFVDNSTNFAVSFLLNPWNLGCMAIVLKWIQRIKNESLLLLKELLVL